ncbi:hypothetical protein XENOCAPTIV_028805 [Xenoophorus captivus]|uniref:Uncharacterized protein n=1 Tax=Xenoophorus captivus TaxID=1517983 RepID=A0ABV0QY97_9TELE
MISMHCNNALSLLPKLNSPFVLLPAATPWKKKSGTLPVKNCALISVQNDSALSPASFPSPLLEFESSQVSEKKRTVYQMALNKLDEILAAAQQTISTNEASGTRGQGPKRDRGRSFYGNEVCIVTLINLWDKI